MNFPNEILNLIVSEGLDCCHTSIAWSQISTAFKDIITEKLGVIVILDGYSSFDEQQLPIECDSLMDEKNTLYTLTDHPENASLAKFIPKYSNILVVVHSNRSYSDVLANMFYDIARNCSQGTSICIIYSTSLNFLSKLYFRELSLYQENITLCELHVIGSSSGDENEMCDINTLFERTYIYNLSSLYSLDVQTPSHKLFSKDLKVIKLLNLLEFNEDTSNFFSECPSLSIIESTKFPTNTGATCRTFRLPRCNSITLTNYVDGSHYPDIDGSCVYDSLTLVPSLRSLDPEFSNLFFLNLKKLRLKLNDLGSHLVRFFGCQFPNLKFLECGSCVVPWSDLIAAKADLKLIKLTLTSLEQLEWISSYPGSLKSLYIEAPQARIVHFPISSVFENSQLYFENISIEISHLWQCYLLEKVVLSHSKPLMSLKIILNETLLAESIPLTGLHISKWGLICEDDYIIFKISFMAHFTLLAKETKIRDETSDSLRIEEHAVSNPVPSPKNYRNVFYDSDASKDITYAVSPSDFRRNSLAGADSRTARRQSAIVFSSSSNEIRKSSFGTRNFSPVSPTHFQEETPFKSENVAFVFSEECPNILTTNIAALESSLLSFSEVKSNLIKQLQIQIDGFSVKHQCEDNSELVILIVREIIRVLKFPYDVRLPSMIIENFQVVVFISQGNTRLSEDQWSAISLEIQTLLAYEGHNLKVFTDLSSSNSRISVLLKRSESGTLREKH